MSAEYCLVQTSRTVGTLLSAVDQHNAPLDLKLANLNQKMKLVPINKSDNILILPYEFSSLIPTLQIKILKSKEELTPRSHS